MISEPKDLRPDDYDREMQFLLAISDELALVQEKKHLVNIFNGRLKSYLGFSESTIFLVNEDVTSVSDFLFGSAMQTQAFVSEIKLGRVPLDDRIQRGEIANAGAVVVDLDELAETKETLPYLQPEATDLFREVVLFNLKRGPEVIGNWITGFSTKSERPRNQSNLLQLLANMINAAVLNIRTSGQLSDVRNEYDTVQSINADLSATRERTDLLRIIHFKLKSLFDFSHHFVSIINEDEMTVTSFLRDSESRSKNHPSYNSVNVTKYPLTDGFFNKAVLSNTPVVFDLTQIRSRGSLPYYLEINYESGIRNVIMTVLKVRDKTIGIWSICQIEHQQVSARQLELIRRLSVQFSIAVANIRSSDLISAREVEQNCLLQFSDALATVRSKNMLSTVISEYLPKLFEYADLQIMLLNDDGDYTCFLDTTEPAGLSKAYTGEFSAADDCFGKITTGKEPVFLMLDHLLQSRKSPAYLLDEAKRGIKAKTVTGLFSGEWKMGTLQINYTQEADYSEHVAQLLRGIAYQLSNTLSNILSFEKITKREVEQDILIDLGRRIAGVRNNQELLDVIKYSLKTAIGFRHTIIAKINEDDQTVSAFLLDPEAASQHHPLYGTTATSKYPLKDGYLDAAMVSGKPILINLAEKSKTAQLPLYLQINQESGINHAAFAKLMVNNRLFGFWIVLFDEPGEISQEAMRIISGLASPISIAIQNIVANASTEQAGEEKSKLIDFSSGIAYAKDLKSLAAVIETQLEQLFSVSDYLFFLNQPEKLGFVPYLYLEDATWLKAFHGDSNWPIQFRLEDEFIEEMKHAQGPLIFKHAKHTPADILVKFAAAGSGEDQILTGPVRMGEDLVGILAVRTGNVSEIQSQPDFYTGICTQMAIVISNIAASEQIKQQLAEISGYKAQLEEEKTYLQEELETTHNYSEIIGESPEIKKIFTLINKVASSDSTVMILGETGTGKELIARAIHNNSPRRHKLMVKVNCATLPANLIESELFGHERGSFTGAMERRLGKFELANNGTLFLDEIGEMPLEMQVKLLRALQEKEIERIGGKTTIKVDVRIVAATNRDLEKEVAEGRFRADLYYRLNIFPISLPPLRERVNDIPLLATHFIRRFSKKMGKEIKMLNNRTLQQLKLYPWPGNIREMEHIIERSMLLNSGDILKTIEMPTNKQGAAEDPIFIYKTIDQNEREHILTTLRACGGKINGPAGAAHILGVPASTLSSKMKRLGIKREHFDSNSL